MILELLIVFVGGIFGGIYGASVGGGALLTLPLLLLIGLPTPVALGTQRLGAVVLELTSSIRYHKEKKLNLKLALLLSLFAVFGAFLGTKFLVSLPTKTTDIVVSVLLIIITIFLFNKDRLDLKRFKIHHTNTPILILTSFLLGLYGGFFGPGFGAVCVIILSLIGFKFIDSAALARVVGVFVSTSALIVFAFNDFVDYKLGAALALGFAIGGWVGVGMAIKKGEKYIKSLLVIVILASLIKILLDI